MSYQNTILGKIVRDKEEEVSSSKFRSSLKEIKQQAKDTAAALDFAKHVDPRFYQGELPVTRIIAEIKKASPSGGLIRPVYKPDEIAREYVDAGAAALSVLTDKPYFQGSLEDLDLVRRSSLRPILRKDFMIDEYQIYEARAHGSDCILAIVAILEKSKLEDFCGLASELGMASLVEVHDEEELQIALSLNVGAVPRGRPFVEGRHRDLPLLGINNRNLKTLVTDLAVTEKLIQKIPADRLVVSESGLKTRIDIERMQKAGAKAFLIGEHLLKEKDLEKKFKEMCGS